MLKKIKISAFLSLILVLFMIHKSNAQSNAGFAPPTTQNDADAYSYSNQYKAKNGSAFSGGVITRDALNQILSNSDCNAITYKLGMDSTGRIAPANTVFIILSGANVTDKNGQTTVTDVGAQKYSPNNWCPPACMKFMIRNAEGVLVPME